MITFNNNKIKIKIKHIIEINIPFEKIHLLKDEEPYSIFKEENIEIIIVNIKFSDNNIILYHLNIDIPDKKSEIDWKDRYSEMGGLIIVNKKNEDFEKYLNKKLYIGTISKEHYFLIQDNYQDKKTDSGINFDITATTKDFKNKEYGLHKYSIFIIINIIDNKNTIIRKFEEYCNSFNILFNSITI